MTANMQEQVNGLETRTGMLESVLAQFISSMNKTMIRMETDTKIFKDEIRGDTKNLKEEMGDERRDHGPAELRTIVGIALKWVSDELG